MTQYVERNLPDWGPKKPIGAPYDDSQRRYAGDMGKAFSFARYAVIWAAAATVGMVGFGGAYIYQDLTTPFVLGMVAHDSDGVPRVAPQPDRPYSPGEGDIAAVLRSFVKDVRWISSDRVRMGASITDAYAYLDPTPKTVLNDYFTREDGKNNPDNLSLDGMVRQVQVRNVSKVAGDTWRVDWTETVLQGNRKFPPKDLTGNFTVKHRQPSTEAQFNANPSGVYITEFYWSVAP